MKGAMILAVVGGDGGVQAMRGSKGRSGVVSGRSEVVWAMR